MKIFKIGRDIITGEFVPIEKVQRNPDRYTIEEVPILANIYNLCYNASIS